jgi:hypothetical protein
MIAKNLLKGDKIQHDGEIVEVLMRLRGKEVHGAVVVVLDEIGEYLFNGTTDVTLVERDGLPVHETPTITVTMEQKHFSAAEPRYTAIFVHETDAGKVPAPSTRGEDPASDLDWDHYNAQLLDQIHRATNEALPYLVQVGKWEAAPKLRFTEKAGCTMCPCSPGMVPESNLHLPNGEGSYDVWISLKPAFFEAAA